MKKDESKPHSDNPIRDLSFILPFVNNGSDDPAKWSPKQLEDFEKTVFAAGEQYTSDTTPVSSPAGEYRRVHYEELKKNLRATIQKYQNANPKSNYYQVWLVCDWVYHFALGVGDETEESSNYGPHQEKQEWIAKTWEQEREKLPSNNQADERVQELYKEKFNGLSISKRQIQRFTGRE